MTAWTNFANSYNKWTTSKLAVYQIIQFTKLVKYQNLNRMWHNSSSKLVSAMKIKSGDIKSINKKSKEVEIEFLDYLRVAD